MEPQTPFIVTPPVGVDRQVEAEEFFFYVNNYGLGRQSKLTYAHDRDEEGQITTRLFVDDLDGRVMARWVMSKNKEEEHKYFLVRYYEQPPSSGLLL